MHTISLLPEFILLGISGILFLSIFVKKESTRNIMICLSLTLGGVMIWSIRSFSATGINTEFYSSLIYDPFTNISRMMLTLSFLATFVFALIGTDSRSVSEIYLLLTLSTLGAFISVVANEFITLYVGLELLAIPTYILIALNPEKTIGIKSAMKYLFTAVIASSFLIIGITFFFGICGSTLITASCLVSKSTGMGLFMVPLFLIIIGVSFKAGLIPTQGWMPDAYTGSTLFATHLLATLPKIVGIAVLFRLIVSSEIFHLQEIQYLVFIFAGGSIIFGSTVAILQKNFRKLLAYAGIAHMGFIFFAVIVNSSHLQIFSWYLLSYIIATIGIFAYLIYISESRNQDEIANHKGILRECPVIAVSAIVVLLSFAGLPPTLGFWAKFSLILELLRTQNTTMIIAAVLLLVFTIIGFYFYLMVIKTLATPIKESAYTQKKILSKKDRTLKWIVVTCAVILVLGGILPEQLLIVLGI